MILIFETFLLNAEIWKARINDCQHFQEQFFFKLKHCKKNVIRERLFRTCCDLWFWKIERALVQTVILVKVVATFNRFISGGPEI